MDGSAKGTTERFAKLVSQSCVVSPLLFNIYGECIINKAT